MTMNVYESQGGRIFEYIDDWGNVYAKATSEEVKDLTWQGIPISVRSRGRYNHPPQSVINPTCPPTTLPRHVDFAIPPSPDGRSVAAWRRAVPESWALLEMHRTGISMGSPSASRETHILQPNVRHRSALLWRINRHHLNARESRRRQGKKVNGE